MANATFEDHPTDPDRVILRKPPRTDTWVGLTPEEIADATKHIRGIHCAIVDEIARATEAKLKEKNT